MIRLKITILENIALGIIPIVERLWKMNVCGLGL